jgi:hypothetical protein
VGIARSKLVWVLQGPDPMAPDRIRRGNDIYRAQAAFNGDLTADASAAVFRAGDRSNWVQWLPCKAYARIRGTAPRARLPNCTRTRATCTSAWSQWPTTSSRV